MSIPDIPRRYLWVLLTAAALLYVYSLNPWLQDFGDSSQYLLLAKAISEGKGLRTINYPGEPLHVGYPPVFPLLLVPGVLVAGLNLSVAKIIGILACLGILGVIGLWLREQLGTPWSAVGVLYLLLSPQLLLYSQKIMSEPVFAFFAMLSLWLSTRKHPNPWAVGLAVAAAYLTRKIGVVLVPAIALAWLLDRNLRPRWRELWIPFGTACLLPIGAWTLRDRLVSRGITHLDHVVSMTGPSVTSWMERIRGQTFYYSGTVSQMAFPQAAELFLPYRWLTVFPILMLIAGCAVAWKKKQRGVVLYALFFSGVLLIWPWNTYRFWVPLIPVFIFLLAMAFSKVPRFWGKLLVVLLALIQVPRTLTLAQEIRTGEGRVPEYEAAYVAGTERLKEWVPREAMLLAPEERMTSLLTGNLAISYWHSVADADSLRKLLKDYRIDYVVYDASFLRVQRGYPVPNPADLAPECLEKTITEGTFELQRVLEVCR